MKKYPNPNHVLLTYRYSRSIIFTGLLCLLCIFAALFIFFMPVIVLHYVDGATVTYKVTGLDILNASLSGFGASFVPINADTQGFLSLLNEFDSSISNPVITLFAQNFAFVTLALAIVTLLPLFASLFQIVNIIKCLFLGKTRNFTSPKGIAKFQLSMTILMTFVYLLFSLVYEDFAKSIYPTSKVEPIYFIYIALVLISVLLIALVAIYENFLKDRIFIDRTQKSIVMNTPKVEEKKAEDEIKIDELKVEEPKLVEPKKEEVKQAIKEQPKEEKKEEPQKEVKYQTITVSDDADEEEEKHPDHFSEA